MDPACAADTGFFRYTVDHLYAAPVMYEYLKKKTLSNLVVVSPDVGGLKMAYAYSQVLDAGLAIVASAEKALTRWNPWPSLAKSEQKMR